MLIYSTSTSLFLCFALLTHSGLGLPPFEAGALFAPASAGFVVASLAAPKIVARWGNRMIAVGALVYAGGITWLALRVAGLENGRIVLALVPPLVLFGFGQGLSMTPLLNLVLGFVEGRHAGMASGVISTMQQVGGAFGVAIVGMFFTGLLGEAVSGSVPPAARYAHAFSGAMFYNVSAVLLAALLVALIGRGRCPPQSR
jgi:hypothetical protein